MTAKSIGVVGGGPAGLRAAEVAAEAGAAVTVYDGKSSAGRKFLVAGKSGLNLTNSANFDALAARYSGSLGAAFWRECLAAFDAAALRQWAAGLGVETFATQGGKVFPVMKKAAPLLRRWVSRLRSRGVKFAMRHRWSGITPATKIALHFENQATAFHDAVVLATGGASWPETGSDGGWQSILEAHGIRVEPLLAANCGWECDWSPATREAVEGQPLHNLRVQAGAGETAGELLLTRYGIEGTCIYQLGRALRAMPEPVLIVDFKPPFTAAQLVAKMEPARRNFLAEARARWRLPDAACAVLAQFHGPFDSAAALADVVKHCRIPLTRPRPLVEAISTAGGIHGSELDASLMLRKMPGVFCAGEMLDWEAPTGGFLLQGCFATGTLVGTAACRFER